MTNNPYIADITQRYEARRTGNTTSAMYSCRIIDVHPERRTVDVLINQSAKTILDVALSSPCFGSNLTEVVIPDVGSEAIIAATSDSTTPFIVAYKQRQSAQKSGFQNQTIQAGEKASIFSKQSFEKSDIKGSLIKSSGSADSAILSDGYVAFTTASLNASLFQNVLSRTYEADEIGEAEVENILEDTAALKDLLSVGGIFSYLKNIRAMQFSDENRVNNLKQAKEYIEYILSFPKHSKFSVDAQTLKKENIPYDKEIEFLPVSVEEQQIYDDDMIAVGTRFIEIDENDYSLIIDMLDETPNQFKYSLYNKNGGLLKTKTIYLDYEKDGIIYDAYLKEDNDD